MSGAKVLKIYTWAYRYWWAWGTAPPSCWALPWGPAYPQAGCWTRRALCRGFYEGAFEEKDQHN